MINLYNTWLDILFPFTDLDFQRKAWFRFEGSEISTFEDAVRNDFLGQYEFLEQSSNDSNKSEEDIKVYSDLMMRLKLLKDKIDNFLKSDKALMDSVFEEKLLVNKDWLQIVDMSQTICNFLKRRIEEIEHER